MPPLPLRWCSPFSYPSPHLCQDLLCQGTGWGSGFTWEGSTGTLVHPEGHSDVTWGTLMFLPIASISQKDPP